MNLPTRSPATPSAPLLQSPVPYDPIYEKAEADEAQTAEAMAESIARIHQITFRDTGEVLRGVHAKSHGLLTGELRVLDGLPEQLAQGMFAQPGSYQAFIRLSTSPGDILHDSISTPRGMALKLLGVPGTRLPGSESDSTQDFLLVNGPAFGSATAKAFLKNLQVLAGTTDKAPGLKKALSAAFRGIETLIEKAGAQSATLKSLGGHPQTEILGETFYSQAPMRFGRYIAKISVAPISAELLALTGKAIADTDPPYYLRDSVVRFFHDHAGEWEVRAQLCTDLNTMPIEDSSVVWPQASSPYLPIARIVVGPQVAWSESHSKQMDGSMAFSPWHGIEAHRPLGSIMRVRKLVYQRAASLRASDGGQPIEEPRRGGDSGTEAGTDAATVAASNPSALIRIRESD